MRRSVGAVVTLICLTGAGDRAAAAPLGVGLYAPDIPFGSPAERLSFVKGIAHHLSNALSTPVEGKAYKLPGDFEKDVRARKIHFAVVGAIYASSRPFTVVARAQLKSGATSTWSLMAGGKTTLAALEGKRLQLPWQGNRTLDLLQNGVLGGTVEISKYFKVARAPDMASAVAAVRFRRADAVLAPTDTPGLVPVVGGIAVPGPAFVVADSQRPAAQVAAATRAIVSYGAAMATIQGWRASGAGPYNALASTSAKKVFPMVLAPAPASVLRVADLVEIGQVKPEPPKLEDLYWIP